MAHLEMWGELWDGGWMEAGNVKGFNNKCELNCSASDVLSWKKKRPNQTLRDRGIWCMPTEIWRCTDDSNINNGQGDRPSLTIMFSRECLANQQLRKTGMKRFLRDGKITCQEGKASVGFALSPSLFSRVVYSHKISHKKWGLFEPEILPVELH